MQGFSIYRDAGGELLRHALGWELARDALWLRCANSLDAASPMIELSARHRFAAILAREDDIGSGEKSEQIRQFQGAFGGHGLLAMNRHRFARTRVQARDAAFYLDASELTPEVHADLADYWPALYGGEAGLLIGLERTGPEAFGRFFGALGDRDWDLQSFIDALVEDIGPVGLFLSDNDSTRSLVLIGSDIRDSDAVFDDAQTLSHERLAQMLSGYGDRLCNRRGFERLLARPTR